MKTGHRFSASNQPANRRQPNFATRLDRALKESGREEGAILAEAIERAFDKEDSASASILSALLARVSPPLKPISSPVEFEFAEGASPADKIDALLIAVSRGQICPDLAARITDVIAKGVEVRERTELAARMAAIEAQLGITPA